MQRKLTFQQAEEIRDLYQLGGTSQSKIAERFGVNRTTVRGIINGRYYTKEDPIQQDRIDALVGLVKLQKAETVDSIEVERQRINGIDLVLEGMEKNLAAQHKLIMLQQVQVRLLTEQKQKSISATIEDAGKMPLVLRFFFGAVLLYFLVVIVAAIYIHLGGKF